MTYFRRLRRSALSTALPLVLIVLSPFCAAANSLRGIETQQAQQAQHEADKLSKFWDAENAYRSRTLYLKAAELWRRSGGAREGAACLREAARRDLMLGKPYDAFSLLESSIAIERKGKNAAGEIEALTLITFASLQTNKAFTAESAAEGAIRKAKRLGDSALLARALLASADVFYQRQSFGEMLKRQKLALHFFRLAGDRLGEGEAQTALGFSYVINNQRNLGLEAAQHGVQIARETGNTRNLAFALIALGEARSRMGEWQAALSALREAESIFPKDMDFFERSILQNRLGKYYLTYGDLHKAKEYLQESLELFRRIHDIVGVSELSTVVGQISAKLGDRSSAVAYFSEAERLSRRVGNWTAPRGLVNEGLGTIYFSEQKYDAAARHYQIALANYKKAGFKDLIASIEGKIGKLLEQTGNFEAARGKYKTALELSREIRNVDAQSEVLFDLARLDKKEGRLDSALSRIEECVALTRSLQAETANDRLRSFHRSGTFDRYALYINLLMKKHAVSPGNGFDITALQVAEQSRARSMLENLWLYDTVAGAGGETAHKNRVTETLATLNAKADELTDLFSQDAPDSETQRVENEINDLENQLQELKASFKQSSSLYSEVSDLRLLDLREFQRDVLDENTLLLEFALGEEESYLWLVGKDAIFTYVLPPKAAIETNVENLRKLFAVRQPRNHETFEVHQQRIAAAESEYWYEARKLSHDLLGHAGKKLSNKRLVIVPDGKLHYFPLAALPNPELDTDLPILLSNETIYAPSAELLHLKASQRSRRSGPEDLLIFADPVFAPDDPRLDGTGPRQSSQNDPPISKDSYRVAESTVSLQRLPGSGSEADSIGELFGVPDEDKFVGLKANRAAFLSLNLSEYRILHFATHGLVDDRRPEVSGIVLSRYDETGSPTDQFIRIQDIYWLNLRSDLVVLSACKTAVGKELKGEGLISLSNAFLQGGSKSVLASLWQVEDSVTLKLMEDFYGGLISGQTSSQALREAQIKLWKIPAYKSPFYWASFTLHGDPNSGRLVRSRNNKWTYGLLILLLAGFAAYLIKAIRRTRLVDSCY